MNNYHSNPASVLAKLIYHGVATESPEFLSPDWRVGYEAARRISQQGFLARREAFEASVANEPACHIMAAEIEEANHYLENPPEDQLRVYSAWETEHDPPPQIEFVVDGVFARSSLNLLVGAPGTKKTWTAIDLAVAVASGQAWLGHSTSNNDSPVGADCNPPIPSPATRERASRPQDGAGEGSIGSPVLLLDAEGGLSRTWDRIRRTINGHNADPNTCPERAAEFTLSEANGRRRGIPLYFIPPVFYNLTDEREVQSITARARSLGAKLIIIDALANVIGLTDENNPASIQSILKRLHQLAEDTGAAVVLVHHTNKEGAFRGSSFIASSVDHMLYVESQPQEALLKLHTVKARDIEPVLVEAFADFQAESFKLVKIDHRLPASRVNLSQTSQNILLYLAEHPQTTTPHLIRQACTDPDPERSEGDGERMNSISPSAARKVIYELMVGGFLCRTDPGSRGRIASYEISDKGLNYLSGHPSPALAEESLSRASRYSGDEGGRG